MGFLSRFFKRGGKEESAPGAVTDDLVLGWTCQRSDGEKIAAACIDRIAAEVAMLSGHVHSVDGERLDPGHWLQGIFRNPDPEEGHFNFFYQSAVDYFNGGVCWLKVGRGSARGLARLPVKKVSIGRGADGRRTFLYDGIMYTSRDVLYIPARMGYSVSSGGQSLFKYMSDFFSTAASVESFTRNSFQNGVVGKRIVMDVSGAFPDITPEQSRKLKDTFQAEYGGVDNAGRPLLKKKGIEYTEIGSNGALDNQSAELSKARDFQRREVASLLGVPLEVLNVSAGNESIENVFMLFAEFAVRPIATQMQEALSRLLVESGDKGYFEFDYNGIMKVSLLHRVQAYKEEIASGLMSPNEARRRENLGPIEAGDTFFVPANYMPLKDETIAAYMAKQKSELAGTQHFAGGDDKQ